MIPTIIVDDEPNIVKWLSSQVRWEEHGYQVMGNFLGGRDALAFLQHHEVQFMLTDIRMPEMDGLELIRRARALHPGVRIIIISAHSEFAYAKEAIQMGVEDYLLKPIDSNELLEAIAKIRENINGDLQADAPEAFRNNVLNRWLHSASLNYTFKMQAEAAGLAIAAKAYLAVALRPLASPPAGQLWLPRAQEALSRRFAGRQSYSLPLRGNRAAYILLDPGPDYRHVLGQVCRELNGGDAAVLMSVGMPVGRHGDLFQSYDVACRYLSVIQMTEGTLLFCEDYAQGLRAAPQHMLGIQRLKQLIREKNMAQASLLADQLLSGVQGGEARQMAISLAAHILEHVQDSAVEPNPADLLRLQMRFRALPDSENIRDWMRSLFHSLRRAASDSEQPMHPRVRDCLSIIHARYADSGLGLNGIAEQLSVSTAYLGQMFKSQTGKYFNDYLNDVRLDAVCRLLLETEGSVGRIAGQAVFARQSYMNRLFKARYKVSPNEMRSLFRLPEL
jgi:YesN/AraC family two-component response regulator